jgi:hypothetical protein
MKIKWIMSISILVALLLLANRALAMSSPNYKMEWFVPVTGSGGSPLSSANYKAYVTIGQTAVGSSSSANYRAGLGYWYGLPDRGPLLLPLILR